VYHGKVRDVYHIGADLLVVVASDRISAFDHVLPEPIPFKGQVLNQLAAHFLRATSDIVPNWLLDTPDPNVSIGKRCQPVPLEMVVRGYLAGHAWRTYREGGRILCGATLPEGLCEGDRLPHPIVTPTTKAHEGHDEDISPEEAIAQGIVSLEDWQVLEKYALALFERGSEMALARGLLLVDTKYEFGRDAQGRLILIDEVHTPDSSRYYLGEGYAERQMRGEPQKQLSKEFVREWLMANGFQGKEGQAMPAMPSSFVAEVSRRYIELFELVTGTPFRPQKNADPRPRIFAAVNDWLSANGIAP
jgi:phosphoribosylaminoimidazole-succinocarboxamide synthase